MNRKHDGGTVATTAEIGGYFTLNAPSGCLEETVVPKGSGTLAVRSGGELYVRETLGCAPAAVLELDAMSSILVGGPEVPVPAYCTIEGDFSRPMARSRRRSSSMA